VTARVLYVVSRFPKVTETFVVNEWAALEPRFDMHLAALVHTREPVLHDATRRALGRVWFVPRLALSTWLAHTRWLARAPRRYLRVWRDVLATARTVRPPELAKSIVACHQAVRLAELAHAAGIDHVHAHFANHPATAAWVVHRLTGIPFSFTAHANDLFRDPPLLVRKADDATFVVAISEYNRRLLARRGTTTPVHVVHCGVDPARFAAAPTASRGPDGGRRTVVCVAGFEPKKGHRDLVAAFATVAARDADVALVLVGDGPERGAVGAEVRRAGLSDRVQFRGATGTDEVRALLRRATLFALPAVQDDTGRMDGIPVALMEAMASGVPVVTTSVSGIPELVDGDCGIVVAPGDRDAIAQAMARLLDDPALAARFAACGRAKIEREFDLHREAARLGDLFESSVARRARPTGS
jgi:glycosyltransferase involved in cell wall biosynthesis